jgi:perosamine synthetase
MATPLTADRTLDIAEVLRRLEAVVGRPLGKMPLHEPTLDGQAWAYVKDALDSTFVSSVGAYVDRFEAMLAEICGVRRAVAVVNGTAALHVALKLAGARPGDEVLLQTLTFIATANAVSYCGAVPHFCDSEDRSFGLDAEKLDRHLGEIAERQGDALVNRLTGRRLAAILPMHVFGHPVDLDALGEVSARWGLPVVEDAAEALGSAYKGRPIGGGGLLSTLSFNGNKIVTTGGGGAILTNDEALGRRAKHLTTTAKLPHRWRFDHDEIGFNYRLPNLNAALGVAQLERLPAFLEAKRRLAERYLQAFAGLPGASVVAEPEGTVSNYWLDTLRLDRPDAALRDALLEATNDAGYLTRPVWTPMHELAVYAGCPRMDLSVAEALEASLVNLPSSQGLELARA